MKRHIFYLTLSLTAVTATPALALEIFDFFAPYARYDFIMFDDVDVECPGADGVSIDKERGTKTCKWITPYNTRVPDEKLGLWHNGTKLDVYGEDGKVIDFFK